MTGLQPRNRQQRFADHTQSYCKKLLLGRGSCSWNHRPWPDFPNSLLENNCASNRKKPHGGGSSSSINFKARFNCHPPTRWWIYALSFETFRLNNSAATSSSLNNSTVIFCVREIIVGNNCFARLTKINTVFAGLFQYLQQTIGSWTACIISGCQMIMMYLLKWFSEKAFYYLTTIFPLKWWVVCLHHHNAQSNRRRPKLIFKKTRHSLKSRSTTPLHHSPSNRFHVANRIINAYRDEYIFGERTHAAHSPQTSSAFFCSGKGQIAA